MSSLSFFGYLFEELLYTLPRAGNAPLVIPILLAYYTVYLWPFWLVPGLIFASLIFYDSSRREMNPWIWAILAFFFWIPVGIAFLVVRSSHPVVPGTAQKTIISSLKRFYFWIASFITLILVFGSLSSSLNTLIGQVFEIEPTASLFGEGVSAGQWLSVSLTTLIITFPIWAIHWIFAQEYIEKKVPEEEKYRAFRELKGYSYLVAVISASALIIFLSKIVYFGMKYLLSISEFQGDRILSSLGTALVAILAGVYHYKVAHRATAVLKGISKPVVEKVTEKKESGKKFCGQCGAKNPPSNKFCSSCGAKL